MTSNRRARIRPVWVPAMPLAILLRAAALAACSGESSGSDAPRDVPLSQETESRNDDSIGAGDGDDTANDVQNDGHDAAGLFVSVRPRRPRIPSSPSAPGSHTPAGRGVRCDGSVACRGSDVDGRATPPDGCLKISAVFR